MADMQLTAEQKQAVTEIERHLQIIACAGSGKTEVIARRIAHILEEKSDVSPQNIVAFTFTNKAAESLRRRITSAVGSQQKDALDGMYIGTIHGYCSYLLKHYADGYGELKVLDTVTQHHFIHRYHKDCGMAALELKLHPRNVGLFVQCIEKMIDDYDHANAWTQEQRDALEQYIQCLRRHGYLDFAILLFEALRQIRSNPACAQAIAQVRYLVVDEYQDVDDLQEKLIGCFVRAGANICVVGDDDQTIYQFRGSNAENMISFAERYPDVRQVRLETNFRCGQEIVDIADAVIRNNTRRLPKEMKASSGSTQGTVQALQFDSGSEQFSAIAEEAKRLHGEQNVPWSEIAVLTRKGKIVARVAWAMERQGIPACGDSAEGFFGEAHFTRLQETLRGLPELNRVELYKQWDDIIDPERFKTAFRELRSAARGGRQRLSTILSGFCVALGFLDEETADYETRKICLDGVCRMLDDYDEIYGDYQLSARIDGFLKFLDTRAAEEYKYHNFTPDNQGEDAVQVMTVHKAKGLEFQCVFLPDLMEKEFPVGNLGGKKYWQVLGGTFEEHKDRYQNDMEDERKLFYVAVTRAKERLYMTYELSKRPVSRFVREAARSSHLQVDVQDSCYDPSGKLLAYEDSSVSESEESLDADWEEERRARQAYWATVKTARERLYEYYGTAAQVNRGAWGDLTGLKFLTPDQILQTAKENGLI